MAVDEALFVSAARTGVATLRFYSWDGPWLSIGYAQPLSEIRRAACREAGVGIVRRVTGGLAVLHGADLTYAIAAPTEMISGGMRASYRLVSDVLCDALAALGIRAARQPTDSVAAGRPSFDCFAVPAGDEICVGGKKLVGSAQRRARGAVLQHGSIRLGPDSARIARAAGLVPGTATSLGELGVSEGPEEIRRACLDAFRSRFSAGFEAGPLTESERRSVAQTVRRLSTEREGLTPISPRGSQEHLSATDR